MKEPFLCKGIITTAGISPVMGEDRFHGEQDRIRRS